MLEREQRVVVISNRNPLFPSGRVEVGFPSVSQENPRRKERVTRSGVEPYDS